MAKPTGRHAVHQCTCPTCQQHPYSAESEAHRSINRVLASLDERNRRRFVGFLALDGRYGNIQQLIAITGLSRNTIVRGRAELAHPQHAAPLGRLRRAGGGRPRVEKNTRAC